MYLTENQKKRIKERVSRIQSEIPPLCDDLQQVGIRFGSEDLGKRLLSENNNFCDTVDILIEHLSKDYSDVTKAVIASELNVKHRLISESWLRLTEIYAKVPNRSEPFRDVFGNERPSEFKESLANVLLINYKPKNFEVLVEILGNSRNGDTRLILLQALRRRKKRPEVSKVLQELKMDHFFQSELSAWKI